MTEIWSHRGVTEYAPENTLPAFEKAVELGVAGIELDVQRTRDGELVVIHDETVDRTSNGSGAVVDLVLDEIRALDVGDGRSGYGGLTVPTLREVMELLAPTGVRLNVELKDSIEPYPGMGLEVRSLATQCGMADRILYSSFNHYSLATLRGRVGREQLGLLYAEVLHEPWRYAIDFGAGAVHPGMAAAAYTPDLVAICHSLSIAVNVWTANDEAHIARLAALGVDVIMTDFPERAQRIVGDML